MPELRLAGKVALVTGAASGIGRAAALRFARDGAAVALADQDHPGAAAAAEEIERLGGRALALRCDVTDEPAVAETVRRVCERFEALHVVVHSAGILQGAFVPVQELDRELFHHVLDVNLVGTFLVSKHAVPVIEAAGGGVLLCLASLAGADHPSSSLAYGASKAGVQGFCRTLERELAPRGIRVNVVCPAAIDTPLKRRNLQDRAAAMGLENGAEEPPLHDPDGVARVLAFLASDDAALVTGAVYTR